MLAARATTVNRRGTSRQRTCRLTAVARRRARRVSLRAVSTNDNDATTAPDAPRYRLLVLGMLVLVYTFNFIDRQIVGILAVPIKADLGLTDTQLGLMGGLAFALFYTALGIPIAMLADRSNRTTIMTVALLLWSAMTAICGFAQSFWQLFLSRLGVGVGEAGGVAPAYSLVADYFPPHQRARALGAYSFGVPIGSALGILFGGFIAHHVDWRTAFIAVGLAGVIVAPCFKLVVKEPVRGRYDGPRTSGQPAGFGEVMRVLTSKPSFWGISFGAAASSMMGYGLFFWLPSFFVRSHGMSLLDASVYFGAILLVGGIAGIWLGGWMADRFGTARKRMFVIIPAIAFVLTVPFYFGAVMSPSLALAFALFMVPTALGLMWLGPVLSAIQHVVPPQMRATASAVFLFVNNLIGIGLGTVALGALSDSLSARYGENSLRYAILAGTVFYLVAASLFLLSAKRLERDWE
jgi:predicted MFS family arabinose efflux permease